MALGPVEVGRGALYPVTAVSPSEEWHQERRALGKRERTRVPAWDSLPGQSSWRCI